MNYDVDLDAKQIYTEKLMNINRQISKVDVVESTSKFNELIGIRGKLEQQLNDLNEKLMNRVINKRDLGEMVLSGIEVFYRRAENNKKEDELFRNKRDMARKDARRIAKEKVEAELEGIIRKNKKDELV
jgi:cytidylate kinase